MCLSELRKLMQCWLESKRAAIIAIGSHYFFQSPCNKDLYLPLFMKQNLNCFSPVMQFTLYRDYVSNFLMCDIIVQVHTLQQNFDLLHFF